MTGMLQLCPQIAVVTPLGSGWAFMVIDYGLWENTVFVVRLDKDGSVTHIESKDIKIEGNPMIGCPIISK